MRRRRSISIIRKRRPRNRCRLLVWIHGGGWQGGSKTQMPYLSQLPRGYVAASIEYRFSQKAKFPAQIQDCQAAIRFLRANAKKYSIDPDRIGVGGAFGRRPPRGARRHQRRQEGVSDDRRQRRSVGSRAVRLRYLRSHELLDGRDAGGGRQERQEHLQVEQRRSLFQPDRRQARRRQGEVRCRQPGALRQQGQPAVSRSCTATTTRWFPTLRAWSWPSALAKAGVEVTLQRLPGAGHGGPAFALPAVAQLTDFLLRQAPQGRRREDRSAARERSHDQVSRRWLEMKPPSRSGLTQSPPERHWRSCGARSPLSCRHGRVVRITHNNSRCGSAQATVPLAPLWPKVRSEDKSPKAFHAEDVRSPQPKPQG